MKFNDLEEFMQYLQKNFGQPLPEKSDFQLSTMTKDSLARIEAFSGQSIKEQIEAKLKNSPNPFMPLLEQLIDQIYSVIPPEIRNSLRTNIGFSVLKDFPLNAMCFKTRENPFIGIFFTTNALTLIWRHCKYYYAAIAPDGVLFCDTTKEPVLPSTFYLEKLASLTTDYHKREIDWSRYSIRLKPEHQTSATATIIATLIELFIICHEFGHILNGDMNRTENYVTVNAANDDLFSPSSFATEFAADATGYGLYVRVAKNFLGSSPGTEPMLRLGPILFFDILKSLKTGLSYTHPDPIQRILRIVKHYHGQQSMEELRRSYGDPELVYEFD